LTPSSNAFDKTTGRGGLDLEISLTAKLYPFSSLIHCQTVHISFFGVLACRGSWSPFMLYVCISIFLSC
jgi:hypothetical protein